MDNQNRSSVLQWLIPTGIMMVVVIGMLLSFSAKSNKEAENSVSKTLIASTEGYGERFLHELQKVGKVGETTASLLNMEGTQDADRVMELLGIAAECAGVERFSTAVRTEMRWIRRALPLQSGRSLGLRKSA